MITGQCQCGKVCYQSDAEPVTLYICHCLECQKQSASAFGISLDISSSSFRLIKRKPKYWSRTTENGKNLKCAFCPTCGSRLWHEYDPSSGMISIKGGSVNEPLNLSNAIHVWVKRKLPGILIPEHAEQFLEEYT